MAVFLFQFFQFLQLVASHSRRFPKSTYVREGGGGGGLEKYACVQGGRGGLIFDILVRTMWMTPTKSSFLFSNFVHFEINNTPLN